MRFDSPQFLSLIPVAFVLLALFALWTVARRRRLLARFGEHEAVAKLTRGVSPVRRYMKQALLIVAVLLILFSLARPQVGTEERPLRKRGVEVLIAIDCSMSMLGQDILPSRLERARDQLRGLVHRLEGDHVGILAFAGIPIVQCPMTSDYSMALNLLDSLAVDTVPVQGTAIGDAIRKAVETFRNPGQGKKVLVLLTDGEDHESDPIAAAEEAAQAGVIIYAIGIGSTQGVPIPLPDGGYKETEGTKVNTRLDFETLREIAYATGGKAIKANEKGDLELEEIYKGIAALKEGDLDTAAMTIHIERFQFFLLPAILALIAEMLLGDRKRRIVAQGTGRFD
jgi:Ca-activated chloride channel homolog